MARGDIHWFVGGTPTGGGTARAIGRRVEDRFPTVTVDGLTLYDLAAAPS